MIAAPAIAMISLIAMLSIVASAILTKPWHQLVALGLAILEIAMVFFLIAVASSQ